MKSCGSIATLLWVLVMPGAEQAASAAPPPAPNNIVGVCSGVRLPNSVVTNIVRPLTTAVGALETTTNSILGGVLGLAGVPPVSTDIAGLMATAGTGYTTIQAVSADGTLIGPSNACYSSADGFTLSTPGGLSIGGNVISGLGDAGQPGAAAVDLGAIAFGNAARADAGATDAIAIGAGARAAVGAVRGVALGGGATVTATNSVALGAGSLAARGALGSYTAPGLGAGQVSSGEVSIGTATARRQITNLAPGSADTDAVNVAQLGVVSNGLAALGNLAVQYTSGSHTGIVLAGGATGTVIGNLAAGSVTTGSTEAVNGAQLFATNSNIGTVSGRVDLLNTRVGGTETAITGLDTRITQNSGDIATLGSLAVRYSSGTYTDIALAGGATGTVISNLAAGSVTAGSTEAVNGAQLFATNSNIGTVSGRVDLLNTRVGGTETAITGLDTRITQNSGDIATLGSLAVRYSSGTYTDIALAGGATGTVISNLAAGSVTAGSTEAVNGAQLFVTNTNVATVSGRVDGLDTRFTRNETDIAAVATSLGTVNVGLSLLNNGGAGPVRYSNALTPNIPNGGVPSQNLTLVGAAPGTVGLHNLSAGVVASGSTDAVNGDQLYSLGQDIAGLSTAAGLAVSYDDVTRSRVTLSGNAGSPVLLTGLAAGSVTAGSTDAVNGAQLFATNTDVATAGTRITALGTRLDGNDALVAAIDTRVTRNTDDIGSLSSGLGTVNGRVDLLDNGGAGPVRYSSATDPTTPNGGVPSQHLTLVGASPGGVSLHNVAPGAIGNGSFDAVNGGQMQTLGQAFAATLGGFTYDGSRNAFNGTFQYNGNNYNNIQSVFGVISSSMNSGPPAGGKYFHSNSTMSDSSAAGSDSTAIGPSASSLGTASIAMGRAAIAMADSAVAIGDAAMATGGMSVSIGAANVASGDGAVAIGDPNFATGDGAVALGKDNISTGVGAIALGNTNNATGQGSAAIGDVNIANGTGATAIGSANSATGTGSIAIGLANMVQGEDSIAIGSNVVTTARDSLALGQAVTVSGQNALALGNRSNAGGTDSAAVGNGSSATGILSAAFGRSSIASEEYALALGAVSQATAFASTALGTGAIASGFAAVTLGTGSIADREGSVALGSASQTVRGPVASYAAFGLMGSQASAGEIAVSRNIQYTNLQTGLPTLLGDRQITGVAAGSADGDAVNVAQLRGVAASLGTALASGLGGGAAYNGMTGSVSAPAYTVSGVTYTAMGDALNALIAAGGTGTGTGGTGTGTGTGTGGAPPANAADTVAYDDMTHGTVTLAPGTTAVRNVAAGAVASGSTDAVNGGQLAATEAKVATLAAQVDNGQVGTVRYTSAAAPATPSGRPTNDVALAGADAAAPVTLHNVAAGQVAVASTDAVNGGQLAATNQRVATVEGTAASAMAMAQGSVQYADAGRTSVTLGNGTSGVALRNVANGTSPTDAVNLGQLTSAANAAMVESKAYADTRVAQVRFDLGKVRKDANAGTAGALALAGMPQPYEAGRGMIAMGAGTFQGQSAIALGIAKALSDEHTVIKIGATYNSRGQAGANAGIGYQF